MDVILELLSQLLGFIVDILKSSFDILKNALEFMNLIFLKVPFMITTSLFDNLPLVFQYGLMSLFYVIYLILILKLIMLFR